MRTLSYNISTEPYALIKTNLIKGLESIKDDLDDAAQQIVEQLCEDGASRGALLNAQAISSSKIKSKVYDDYIDEYHGRVVMEGDSAIYDEFGTGEKGADDGHPLKGFYGLNPYNSGPFVSTHINRAGRHYWFAPPSSSTPGYTEGIPSGKQMYNTLQYIRQIKDDVIQEKIKNSINRTGWLVMDDTLLYQLVADIGELFSDNTEYGEMLVKEKYEIYPKITYPGITIEEIQNEDNNRFFDETERVSNMGYQFAIYAEQSETKTAVQNVRAIAKIIDDYLKGPRYRCFRRLGSLAMVPESNDNNVMIGYLRYECSLELDTNTIYRR